MGQWRLSFWVVLSIHYIIAPYFNTVINDFQMPTVKLFNNNATRFNYTYKALQIYVLRVILYTFFSLFAKKGAHPKTSLWILRRDTQTRVHTLAHTIHYTYLSMKSQLSGFE